MEVRCFSALPLPYKSNDDSPACEMQTFLGRARIETEQTRSPTKQTPLAFCETLTEFRIVRNNCDRLLSSISMTSSNGANLKEPHPVYSSLQMGLGIHLLLEVLGKGLNSSCFEMKPWTLFDSRHVRQNGCAVLSSLCNAGAPRERKFRWWSSTIFRTVMRVF